MRVESSVGRGESASEMSSGISVQPSGLQQEPPGLLPPAGVDVLHVPTQGVRVHRHLGMAMRAEEHRPFGADRAIAEGRALGADGDDANVPGVRHLVADSTRRDGGCGYTASSSFRN
jgi:hypothetical protein